MNAEESRPYVCRQFILPTYLKGKVTAPLNHFGTLCIAQCRLISTILYKHRIWKVLTLNILLFIDTEIKFHNNIKCTKKLFKQSFQGFELIFIYVLVTICKLRIKNILTNFEIYSCWIQNRMANLTPNQLEIRRTGYFPKAQKMYGLS